LTSLITAACHGENFRKRAAGERERFRTSSQGRIALSEWSLDRELLRLEKEVQVHLERYQTLALQRLTRRISELPSKAIGELVLVLLQRMDYADFQLIRRPGAHPAELHLSAVQRTPLGDARVAIVVRRDGRDIGRERVTELRGSLHHYGRANSGLLITTGQVMSGAREEAAAPGATPMSFVDGAKIAQLCEQSGVGVVRSPLSLFTPDAEFFDSLRAG
jgi:restriction endonuclease Mrr